jgi:hypothetical protein
MAELYWMTLLCDVRLRDDGNGGSETRLRAE